MAHEDIADLLGADGAWDGKDPQDARALMMRLAQAAPIWTPAESTLRATQSDRGPGSAAIVPAFRSMRQLIAQYPALREPVIHGLLRKGETLNIIAPSKGGKTWLATDLGLAVATGGAWLGAFPTEQGDVLILDNELHRESTAFRIPRVAEARGISVADYQDRLFVENLRGRLLDLYGLPAYFASIEPGRFKIVVLDALYRFWPKEHDENDNGTITGCYNILDSIADRLGCCFVVIHHASKGNQSGKSVTDVGAGAGAQSRAADNHLVLRPHETDTPMVPVVVLEAAPRNWPRVEPCCLRWTFPVWNIVTGLDPAALRRDYGRQPRIAKPKDDTPQKPRPPSWDVARFMADFVTMDAKPRAAIIADAVDKGLSERRAEKLLKSAEGQSKAHRWKVGKTNLAYFANRPQPQLTDGTEAAK